MSKVRQKDLAKAANVSVSTVSLALRDHPSISAATKKKVLELQKKIGYSPSKAVSLGKERPHVLFCLIRRELNNPLYNPFLEGVVAGCKHLRAPLDIDFVRGDEEISAHPFQTREGDRPDAIILAGAVTEEIVKKGKAAADHVVVLGTHHFNEPVHRVDVDLEAAAKEMVARAIKDGSKTILLVSLETTDDYNRDFDYAIRKEAARAGLPISADHCISIKSGDEADLSKVVAAISSLKGQEVAVMVSVSYLSKRMIEQIGTRKSVRHYVILIEETPLPGVTGLELDQRRLGLVGVDLIHSLSSKTTNYTSPYTVLLPPARWVKDVGRRH